MKMRDGSNVAYSVNNTNNRYNTVGGNSLSYDAAGNLITDKDGFTYHYDYENRIVKIRKSNDAVDVATYDYDALGRRIQKVIYVNGLPISWIIMNGHQVIRNFGN
ncbi:MAG: hypothetical protein ABSB91_03945 [Sedimentisphaerales bacterium]